MLIHKAAPDDLTFCHHLTELENWNYSFDEMSMLYATPGATFFIARDKIPMGMVATFLCGPTAWLGLLIVRHEYRGEGIGTMLMKRAMQHVQSHGVITMRLEAVQDAIPLYERLGFYREFSSLRLKKQGDEIVADTEYGTFTPDVLEEIALFDAPYYGTSRFQFLQRCCELSTLRLVKNHSSIAGYLLARTANSHKIGPCVAENGEVFEYLLKIALHQLRGSISIGIPACNEEGVDILTQYGFTITSTSVRMVWGIRKFQGNPEKIYAIGGPEKG
jgi:GNAT superfamily N-acetyltransferase